MAPRRKRTPQERKLDGYAAQFLDSGLTASPLQTIITFLQDKQELALNKCENRPLPTDYLGGQLIFEFSKAIKRELTRRKEKSRHKERTRRERKTKEEIPKDVIPDPMIPKVVIPDLIYGEVINEEVVVKDMSLDDAILQGYRS